MCRAWESLKQLLKAHLSCGEDISPQSAISGPLPKKHRPRKRVNARNKSHCKNLPSHSSRSKCGYRYQERNSKMSLLIPMATWQLVIILADVEELLDSDSIHLSQ